MVVESRSRVVPFEIPVRKIAFVNPTGVLTGAPQRTEKALAADLGHLDFDVSFI